MNRCFLPTLSDILATVGGQTELDDVRDVVPRNAGRLKAEREWYGAVAALNQLLVRDACPGVILSGPSSVLTHANLAGKFESWIFTSVPPSATEGLSVHFRQRLPLLPATEGAVAVPPVPALLLREGDPLAQERFCVVLTSHFSLVMVFGETPAGVAAFQFSFDPEVVTQAWIVLRQRVLENERLAENSASTPATGGEFGSRLAKLDQLFEEFFPVAPHYRIVTQFSRLLLQHLPQEESVPKSAEKSYRSEVHASASARQNPPLEEVEFLQAIAHEVRTPLATIRTLTRLLLKRPNLDPVVVKRLEMIDAECTAQIDRFSLIFRAVELEASQVKESPAQLTAMSLGEVFQTSLPRWQKQASQRNHTLEVILPQRLPTVVSDPAMLDQVLTGLIENFTRTLPAGSHIQVGVMLAGNQLKLQLESQPQAECENPSPFATSPLSFKSIGPLLMFQPETGSVTLNLSVTKNLFRAAGGKLVVRQRPQKGEVMTVFLPLQ